MLDECAQYTQLVQGQGARGWRQNQCNTEAMRPTHTPGLRRPPRPSAAAQGPPAAHSAPRSSPWRLEGAGPLPRCRAESFSLRSTPAWGGAAPLVLERRSKAGCDWDGAGGRSTRIPCTQSSQNHSGPTTAAEAKWGPSAFTTAINNISYIQRRPASSRDRSPQRDR